MAITIVHVCQCTVCQQGTDCPERTAHQQINLIVSRLNEQQRRWFVAFQANQVGHGGLRLLSMITGLDEKTIRRGQEELANLLVNCPPTRQRHPGAGRPSAKKVANRDSA
jgi:hypothetical protein